MKMGRKQRNIRDISGSEEIMDRFCESCFKDGVKNVRAEGFCISCVTFFCKTCLKYHAQYLPDHVQQNDTNMSNDFVQQSCKTHQNEIRKFYCLSCETYACASCKATTHKKCKSVQYIPSLLSDFDEKNELNNYEGKLHAIEVKLQKVNLFISQGYENMKRSRREARSAIRKQKQNISMLFDKLEKEVESETDDAQTEVKKNLAESSTEVSKLMSKFRTVKAETKGKKQMTCEMFDMVKTGTKEIKSIDKRLENMKNADIHEICFEPTHIIRSTGDIGKLNVTKRRKTKWLRNLKETSILMFGVVTVVITMLAALIYGNFVPDQANLSSADKSNKLNMAEIGKESSTLLAADINQNIEGSNKKIREGQTVTERNNNKTTRDTRSIIREKPILISETDVKTKVEDVRIELHKICHLHRNYLVAVDMNINLLLLISDAKKKVVSDFQLKDSTVDLTTVSKDQVAVSYLFSSKIHIIQIQNLDNRKAISWKVTKLNPNPPLDNPAPLIHFSDRKIFIPLRNKILSFDMKGNKQETILLNNYRDSIIVSYLAMKNNGESLHLFSYFMDNPLKIIHVTPDKVYETTYAHSDIKGPTGMVADDRGNVYVCGFLSNNIYVMSGDLTQGKVLLNMNDGIKSPTRIAYNNEDSKLYITGSSSEILVFRLV